MDFLIPIIIYLVVPFCGVVWFFKVNRKMNIEEPNNPPLVELFLLFLTYGNFLLIVLTGLFWKWSGMTSIAGTYLILVGPIVMGITIFANRKKRLESKYRNYVFKGGIAYFVLVPLLIGFSFLVEHLSNG